MCGIVAYTGREPTTPYLLEGLKHLEYRGYDSAGIALADAEHDPVLVRAVGTIENFNGHVDPSFPHRAGIAHTRWATHGAPTEANAHPQNDCTGTIRVVHNGILENADELRRIMIARGHRFASETDTECIAHAAEELLRTLPPNPHVLEQVAQALFGMLTGAFAVVLQFTERPNLLLALKRECPLLIGIADHGHFLASDPSAFADSTRRMVELPDACYALIAPGEHRIFAADGSPVSPPIVELSDDVIRADRGSFAHFMLKEIHEQPAVIAATLEGRFERGNNLLLPGRSGTLPDLSRNRFDRIMVVACGTSFHAGLIGVRLLGKLWPIPVGAALGSEARYAPWLFNNRTLAVFLSQSGETADTYGALEVARAKGATTVGIVNETQTIIGRGVDGLLPLRVGPERSVASTKAFTAQVAALSLLALHTVPDILGTNAAEIRAALTALPEQITEVLRSEPEVRHIAAEMAKFRNALYLGRGYNLATALEGALKLKEVSYLHAEGQPSAEMKHGTIALIEEQMPVVFIAPLHTDEVAIEKILSNVREVHARSTNITVVASEGDPTFVPYARHLLRIPRTLAHLTPILAAVVLQLLAYHVAILKGFNPDQPRHLAKAVTVE